MDWLIILGATISGLGLVGLLVSAAKIVAAKRAGLDDEALRGRLQKMMVLNFASLLLSVFGLMIVVIGIVMA